MAEEFNYDVFLSHSVKDKPIVRELAERLRNDGLKVWLDEWVLKPGDHVQAKIEEGLEQSRVLVLCMSANAFGSDWAQLEACTFRFRDPMNRERRFIPLRLDDTPIKGSLAQFLYINWLPEGRDQEYLKLFEASCPPATKTEYNQTMLLQNVNFSHPEPNIVCAGIADLPVELNKHEVFRQSENTRDAFIALTARFHNKPTPSKKVGSVANVTAQILYYSLNWPERLDGEVQYGCWLNEESPHVTFDLNTTHHLLIGLLDRSPAGGFKPDFRVYGNSLDKNASLSRLIFSNHPGFRIRINLTVGEHGELSTEHDLELRTQSHDNKYNSYEFVHLTKGKKQERNEILATQLKQLIAEGEKFIIGPKEVTDWSQFCWEANTWRYKVEKVLSENLGMPHSIRFLDVNSPLRSQQLAREIGNQFLDEFRTRLENLKAISIEREEVLSKEERVEAYSSHCAELREKMAALQENDASRLDTRRKGKLLALEVGARIASADQKCFEIPATEDEGIDMELEFTDDDGKGTGRRLYLQLKSGNSHLKKRKDGTEVFAIKDPRWVEYWLKQPHPVMLVIGTFATDDERSIGRDKLEFAEVRWMEISSVLQRESQNGTKPVKQIEFKGERLDMTSIRRWRDKMSS